MAKTWTELLGSPKDTDHVYHNEIVRPTEYFTLTDFGHRKTIWKTLWKEQK